MRIFNPSTGLDPLYPRIMSDKDICNDYVLESLFGIIIGSSND